MEFLKFNANPLSRRTGDCVIRAICTALEISWKDTYKEMLNIALDTGYAISCKENFSSYLDKRGYKMQKMPKKDNGKRYTLSEFADKLAASNKVYVINLANHTTCLKGNVLYDTWNCGNKYVGNYWIIDRL